LFITLSLFVVLLGYVLINSEIFPHKGQNPLVKEVEEYPSEWVYSYSDIDVDECYPIVALRSGYKIIREHNSELLLGWKYELVNTISEPINVTVNYKILDFDGFEVCEVSESKFIQSKSIDTIQDTFTVPSIEKDRLQKVSWTISPGTYNYSNLEKYNHNRYLKCAEIISTELEDFRGPFWIRNYLQYVYSQSESSSIKDTSGKYRKNVGKWDYLANILEIKPLGDINNILDKLDVTFHIPPLEVITASEEYNQLTSEEKSTFNNWLQLQRDFGNYSNDSGGLFLP